MSNDTSQQNRQELLSHSEPRQTFNHLSSLAKAAAITPVGA
jgi:hypothetical protein